MNIIKEKQFRKWVLGGGAVESFKRMKETLGISHRDACDIIGLGPALSLAADVSVKEGRSLDSIPFHSLCRGALLPLSGYRPAEMAHSFGFRIEDLPPADQAIGELVKADVGLTLAEKIGVLIGDPFGENKGSGLGFDTLVNVLCRLNFCTKDEVLDSVAGASGLGRLFTISTSRIRSKPALTSCEVLSSMRGLQDISLKNRERVVFDLMRQAGRLERHYIYKLISGNRSRFSKKILSSVWLNAAKRYSCDVRKIIDATRLVDPIDLGVIIENHGGDGLKRITLRPLCPVRPMLCAPKPVGVLKKKFPVWVECKYDGIRIHSHIKTDADGNVLVGLFTRKKNNWTTAIPWLASRIRKLGRTVGSAILDGELHGVIADDDGFRNAKVHEVYRKIRTGDDRVRLIYSVFDLLYLNGRDFTGVKLVGRRAMLKSLALPEGIEIAKGQSVVSGVDLNSVYSGFVDQGYEGLIVKDLKAKYLMDRASNDWLKKKRESTVSLCLTSAYWSSESDRSSIGALGLSVCGSSRMREVCVISAPDRESTMALMQQVTGDGLIMGPRIQRDSSGGKRSGFAIKPCIVIDVAFETLSRSGEGTVFMRGARFECVRADLVADDICSLEGLEQAFVSQRLS